ncbi:MAG: hypothetical protein ABIK92_13350 [Pseudomonadota bacterium]
MDHVTSLDVILIQSSLLPDHICHPGFGMYFPLVFSTKIASFFNIISIINLEELAASINPIGGYAELTDYIRAHSPFIAVGIVIILTSTLCFLLNLPGWFALLIALSIGTQESLVYHSSMIRTDFYSVFWWAASLPMLTAQTHTMKAKSIFLFIGGILLGLSFLAKVQSLFLIPLAIIICIFGYSFSQYKNKFSVEISRHTAIIITSISLAGFLIFIFFISAANLVIIPPGVPTWAKVFGITPIVFLFGTVLFLLFVYQLFFTVTGKFISKYFLLSSFITIIAAGFLASFFLHFAIYPELGISFKYLLLDFKMMFLRDSKLMELKHISIYFNDFISYILYNPVPFVVNFILLATLAISYRFKLINLSSNQLLLCFLATAIVFTNMFVATRFIIRDILWKEIPLNFLNLLFLAIILTRAMRYEKAVKWIGSGLIILFLITNCIHSAKMPSRIAANYNHYGWDKTQFFNGTYGGNHRLYTKLIRNRYTPNTAMFAATKAVNHNLIKNTLKFVFQNQIITHQNIGIVLEGMSVYTTNLNYKIIQAPAPLRGAIIFDSANAKIVKNHFLKQKYVLRHSEYLDKLTSGSDKSISVLPRTDLNIFLFVKPKSIPSLLSKYITESSYSITLQKNGQSFNYKGLEIINYCEIALENLGKNYFFVIQKT